MCVRKWFTTVYQLVQQLITESEANRLWMFRQLCITFVKPRLNGGATGGAQGFLSRLHRCNKAVSNSRGKPAFSDRGSFFVVKTPGRRIRWRGSVLRSAAGSDLKLGNCLTSALGSTTTSCSRLIPSCSNVVSVSMLPGLEGREDREKWQRTLVV